MGSTVFQGDPPPLVTSTRSWVAVAQKKQEKEVIGEQESVVENGKEKEEGGIHEWQRVSQEKASRTPKSHDLNYGQVMIATPSRYAALSNSGENGEDIEHEEIEGSEEEDREVVEEGTINKMIEDAIKKVEESKGSNTRQMLPR
ncbi:hypothetical protein IGI04_002123, partial [Brassica rapa subsp. trilocularis]